MVDAYVEKCCESTVCEEKSTHIEPVDMLSIFFMVSPASKEGSGSWGEGKREREREAEGTAREKEDHKYRPRGCSYSISGSAYL